MSIATEAPLHIGKVALVVHDLEAVRDFYQRAIGLQLISGDGETALLGAGDVPFFELRRDPAARRSSHQEAGLFHTAFLLPTRPDLGRWMRHAFDAGLKIDGAADHVVSEAIYLADPEGNGVEVYFDREPDQWPWENGTVQMRNDRLDRHALADAGGDASWRGAPEGAVVGHVHLQVGELPASDAFYAGVLGLDVTCRYPGATFLSSGGYHHHVGTNIWNSRGAPVRTGPATGLAEVEMVVEPVMLEAIRGRAGGTELSDPWGTRIVLRG